MGIVYDCIINTLLKYKKINKVLRYICNGLYFISFDELLKNISEKFKNIPINSISQAPLEICFKKANKAHRRHFNLILDNEKSEIIDIIIDDLPRDENHLLFKFIDNKYDSNHRNHVFEPLIYKIDDGMYKINELSPKDLGRSALLKCHVLENKFELIKNSKPILYSANISTINYKNFTSNKEILSLDNLNDYIEKH